MTRSSTGFVPTPTSTSRPTPGPTSSSASSRAGPTRCGCRASGSGPSAAEKDGDRFEITTFRAEIYRSDSRKPEVTFSDDIATDLSRRDFTINAIAIALDDPDLVDPHGGLDDLVARRLRTPLSPEISFGDDPLRMLRAARFVATLGFEPDAELLRGRADA